VLCWLLLLHLLVLNHQALHGNKGTWLANPGVCLRVRVLTWGG